MWFHTVHVITEKKRIRWHFVNLSPLLPFTPYCTIRKCLKLWNQDDPLSAKKHLYPGVLVERQQGISMYLTTSVSISDHLTACEFMPSCRISHQDYDHAVIRSGIHSVGVQFIQFSNWALMQVPGPSPSSQSSRLRPFGLLIEHKISL